MALTFADVVKAKYISLTTFTKDGRPKPTAIWVVPDGDAAVVITEKNAWKVKRIRNTPRVTVAICDMRGNVKSEAVEAVASVLDESQTERVYQAIGKRYGIVGHVFNFFSKLRGGAKRTIGLELRAVAH
jgi:PPOX class probable F420-dependent enzyme